MSYSRGGGARGLAGALVCASVVTAAVGLPSNAVAQAGASAAPIPLAITADGATAHAIKSNTRQLDFGSRRAGTYFGDESATIVNTGSQSVTINRIAFHGGDAADFVVGTTCFPHGRPSTLAPHAKCVIKAIFTPHAYGVRTATIGISDSASSTVQPLTLRGIATEGYYIAGPRGGVAHFGDAVFHGDRGKRALNKPTISLTATSSGAGYWLLASDGGIFSYGNAHFYGSTGSLRLNRPVVGMATDRANNGYWLVASDGGIFTFGHAGFHGSTGGMHLNRPIIGMAATRSGNGYWLVASDGGIFTFGDAKFYGSVGATSRSHPIVGMATTPSGHGYWLVARNGRVFAFGDARVHGADGSRDIGVVVGMAPTADGRGFWLLNTQAHVIPFGDARFFGDLHRSGLATVVGIAATAPGVGSKGSAGVVDAPTAAALNARLSALAARFGLRSRPA